MARVTVPSEADYVAKRLSPLLERLRSEPTLREEFFAFARERGGSLELLVGRLHAAWWKSRRPQFTPFFALILAEFAVSHGGLDPRPTKKATVRRRPRRTRRGKRA